jgi:hypothetical protein
MNFLPSTRNPGKIHSIRTIARWQQEERAQTLFAKKSPLAQCSRHSSEEAGD